MPPQRISHISLLPDLSQWPTEICTHNHEQGESTSQQQQHCKEWMRERKWEKFHRRWLDSLLFLLVHSRIITHLAFVRKQENKEGNVRLLFEESYIILARHSVEFTSAWIFSRFSRCSPSLLPRPLPESSYFITICLFAIDLLLLCDAVTASCLALESENNFINEFVASGSPLSRRRCLRCLVLDFRIHEFSSPSSDLLPRPESFLASYESLNQSKQARKTSRRAITKSPSLSTQCFFPGGNVNKVLIAHRQ